MLLGRRLSNFKIFLQFNLSTRTLHTCMYFVWFICSVICFQAFQKEDIDPLQVQLQDINSLGQGLIQTAAKGADTKKLEDDLEEVNTKWNTLNKKVIWFLTTLICVQYSLTPLTTSACLADRRALGPTARSPAALREVPGRAGVAAQLVDWHRGAGGQSKTAVGRVQSGQGTNTRAESKCSFSTNTWLQV